MKVFLSWSGPNSFAVANALKQWLPYIFTDIQTFFSSDDVRKGKRWLTEITKGLSTCNFGIVCLTPDNLDSPWLLFEAGALSKLRSSNVCTLLVGDLRPGDIEGPLSHFQATIFSKADFFKLMQSLNSTLGKSRLEEPRLITMFDKWWVDLEKGITDASKQTKAAVEAKRTEKDILYEVLEVTREIARNIQAFNGDEALEKLRKLLKIPITELEFSSTTNAILQNANIYTVGQLTTKTEAEVAKYRGVRRAAFNEIRDKLATLGLVLGMSFDPIVFTDLDRSGSV